MTYQEQKEYNAKRRIAKVEDHLMMLSRFKDGAPIQIISEFLSASFDHYIIENIELFSIEGNMQFSLKDPSFSSKIKLNFNIRQNDEFTRVFNKCMIIVGIRLSKDTYEEKLQKIKDLDINNENDKKMLKQWANENYEEAMTINNLLIEDKQKKEEDNNLLVLHKSDKRSIVVDYSLFQNGVDFSSEVLDIWFETC